MGYSRKLDSTNGFDLDDLKRASLLSNVTRLVPLKKMMFVSIFSSSQLFQDAFHFLL